MEIPTLKCTVCSRNIDPFDVKYHNDAKQRHSVMQNAVYNGTMKMMTIIKT